MAPDVPFVFLRLAISFRRSEARKFHRPYLEITITALLI
ncbi:hypothetical protein SAMN05443249_0536 [Beijerinckia sp. 28-YEA-48]|nr:hypothetical protein SAMN05443249_0536 [Beijerinckia sp. 28-YEA-48]